ncbi:hypothetical protein FF011L_17510 [Roseimaritima multifibrata]|uniref:Uncharacterized protein n=1 Tax=Roseimaritima multifibrata TaxID=1930274 RepID=A0A517MDT6_9BACT|nr:hypothetical protein FF011L_17510 [Roseimaritima multifibrata]
MPQGRRQSDLESAKDRIPTPGRTYDWPERGHHLPASYTAGQSVKNAQKPPSGDGRDARQTLVKRHSPPSDALANLAILRFSDRFERPTFLGFLPSRVGFRPAAAP